MADDTTIPRPRHRYFVTESGLSFGLLTVPRFLPPSTP